MKRTSGISTCMLLALVLSAGLTVRAQQPADKAPAAKDGGKTEAGAGAEITDPAAPEIPAKIRELLQERKYAEAVEAIKAAEKDPKAPLDYLAYLRGRALHLMKEYNAAVDAFAEIEKKYPGSLWARRGRFARAVSFMRKGDFRSAEQIYRAEVTFLLSEDRKQEIADIYLQYADGYFKPEDQTKKPDYTKALQFYTKALEVGPKKQRQSEVELRIAECYQLLGNHQEAARRYAKFIEDHKTSDLASQLVVQARFRLGESQLAMGQRVEARRTWQDLIAAHPDSPSERLAEAAFNLSKTYAIPTPPSEGDLALGVAALESFLKKYPMHKLAGQAHLNVAAAYAHRGRYDDAVKSLDRFLADKRYADRKEIPDARYLLGRAYQLEQKFAEAIAVWRDYLAKHPSHQQWTSAQTEIINTEYLMGQQERAAKNYAKARTLWSEFLVKYPLDGRGRSILLLFGRMNFDREKWDEAIADWRRLVSKYPGTNESSHAQYMIGYTLETKLAKLEEALKEYRKVTWGSYAGHAGQRIAELTRKSIAVATERVFRTNETPRVKLTTRNVESVDVRVYTVDLETYFRKMHLARGVEGLDISLIDPDKTFEFKVPGYAQYQQLDHEVEVPLPAIGDVKAPPAGVLAVTVSSKTLTATTMIVQSDLDVIVKSSRDEVFVFAENMRTGKPWPKARLLISDGKQVFAGGTTGDDGVFQKSYEQLKAAGDVRVFAVADGSVASNVVSLSGVGVARGLTDKGYIYTERPAYRAGQVVHVRGVIRRVTDDTYTIEQGKKYTLTVLDSRNRQLRSDEVALGDFGSFHANFALPATSPPGEYRIQVRDRDGKAFQGGFVVHQYQLQPMRLSVDTAKKVFYRGEEIEGTIKAAFYYGAPLAGRTIRYRLAEGRIHTATTDDAGEVKFKLPTREFREDQVLPLYVELPERSLSTAQNFFLATRGFSIGLATPRPVYVAGETFEVTVSTTSAEGKPAGHKLTLHVLEQTNVDGKTGERPVAKHQVETDKDTGEGRVTLRLDKGATYLLRAVGTDQFDNQIAGTHAVNISDDSDQVRLRILADRHTFKTGDTAAVQLHWREAPALALVTFQGARVLDYRLVTLQTGANKLEIPMTARLAPNFELSVAVMTDARAEKAKAADGKADGKDDAKDPAAKKAGGEPKPVRRFHVASSPFTVQRDLRVAVKYARADGKEGPIRPGDEVKVTITTTDPQGQPVAAEVALAMVEQSLLEMFSSRVSAIDEFFRGQLRETAVRTTSSVTFAYRPSTQAINPRLLAEAERRELEKAEAELLADANHAARPAMPATPPADQPPADPAASAEPNAAGDLFGPSNAPGRNGQGAGQNEQKALEELRRSLGSPQNLAQGFGGWQGGQAAGKQAGEHGDLSNLQAGAYYSRLKAADGDDGLAYGWSYTTPTTEALQKIISGGRNGVAVVLSDGRQHNIQFGTGELDVKRISELSDRLTRFGAVILPELLSQETGYWNPVIATDAKGTATLTLTMPERSTSWKLLAKGVTTDTLAGEATGELAVKKDLFGDLKLPLAFTDGDEAAIPVTVHNSAVEKGAIQVTLKTTIGGKEVSESKKLDVDKQGLREVVFKVAMKRPADAAADQQGGPDTSAAFELTIASGDQRDVVRQSVPIRPYGVPVFVTAGGSASSDTTVWVAPPVGMPVSDPRLQVIIGPTVERSLLDAVLGTAPWCQVEAGRYASGLERATSDLTASLALQKLLGATRDAGGPQTQALDSHIRAAISQLVSAQLDDGGWSWTGRGGASNRYSSARVVWALHLAKDAGYEVPTDACAKSLNYLRSQIAATGNTDYESKAVLLHALSTAGQGDFTLANRLHRNRQAMSTAALVYLTLTFAEMDRKPMAGDVLLVLAQRNLDEPPADKAALRNLPWNHAGTELRALYALALVRLVPQDAKAKEQVDWLMAHRTGHRWNPEKATGPAMLAVCEWFAASRFKGEHYQLAVFVNDLRAALLDIKEDSGTLTVDVPAKFFKQQGQGKQRINFQLTGRGRFAFQCIYGGFVAADKLAGTTADWRVERHYEPAPLELDGQTIPRGFGLLEGSYESFRNPLTQLPVGQRGHVELIVYRNNLTSSTTDEELAYLVVSESLPAGTTVVENTISGNYDRYEITPGMITFYVGSRRHVGTIQFDVHGYVPGEFRTVPTLVRDAYRPQRLAIAKRLALAVLPAGEKSVDKYRLTPQELYELGKRRFAKQELKTAGGHLGELFANWSLKADVYKDTARMLLDVHVQTGPPREIVRYFEIIKEKWPQLNVSFDKIVKVAAAYHEIGEYERSFLVFRATVQSSFGRESGVGGFLESQGEFTRGVNFMSRLLREYPPEPYVAAATYALAQRVYAKAPEAAADAKLREAKVYRVDLVRKAWAMLDDFVTEYPEDPAADQAAFSIANALLELKNYQGAIEHCRRYAQRYAESELLDSYWYVIAFSHFAQGQTKEALEMAAKVAAHKRMDARSGRETESANKWRAIYIMAQVHHSLGEAAKAIAEYTRVKERFADAVQAIDYFARQEIKLPEVTSVKPGQMAEVTLDFRNVPKCDVKVYRIDLMKFSLLRKNLAGITKINLAGIRPHHQAEIELGDGKDYRDRQKKISLPLKEEGAYLVVARGGDLHASGLVLVSPLVVEVQQDATSGRVRTTIKDTAADRYVSDVHIKVIGSRNTDFTSGETDLRGVFVADDIRGRSTVIAQAEGTRYAFFRGTLELGPPPATGTPKFPAATTPPQSKSDKKGKLLEGLELRNRALQQEQQKQLDDLYQAPSGGVEAQKAF